MTIADPWQPTREFMQALADHEDPMPEVRGGCMICRVTPEDVTDGRVLISPTGIAHHGAGDRTRCGHNATGDKWWWPL